MLRTHTTLLHPNNSCHHALHASQTNKYTQPKNTISSMHTPISHTCALPTIFCSTTPLILNSAYRLLPLLMLEIPQLDHVRALEAPRRYSVAPSACKKAKTTTPRIPMWSPTMVLTRRYSAWLRRSDGMRYFLSPMAVDVICPKCVPITWSHNIP